MTITIEQVEQAVQERASEWVGRCYEISHMVIRSGVLEGVLDDPVAVYGHWLGIVHEDSYFGDRCSVSFQPHGWIAGKGLIIDPTRWVFEHTEPYIYVGDTTDSDYDEGGNQLRAKMLKPPPVFDQKRKTFYVDFGAAKPIVSTLLGYDEDCFTDEQIFWLSNLSFDLFSGAEHTIYQRIIDLGLGAFIPIDNRMRSERGSKW